MNFGEVREGVASVWDFITPPFINLAALCAISEAIDPGLIRDGITRIPLVDPAVFQDPATKSTLEFYGVNSLLPWLLLLALVFALFAFQKVLLIVGHLLPGEITGSEEALLKHCVSASELVEWRKRYPEASSAHQAVKSAMLEVESSSGNETGFWDRKIGRYYLVFNALKVYALAALLLPLVAVIRGGSLWAAGGRSVLVLLGLTIAAVPVLVGFVYAREQRGFALARAIRRLHIVQPRSAAEWPDDRTASAVQEAMKEQQDDDTWWEFRLFGTYRYNWFLRTFLDRPE